MRCSAGTSGPAPARRAPASRLALAFAAAASLGLVAPACTTARGYETAPYAYDTYGGGTYDDYGYYDDYAVGGDLSAFYDALDPYGRWLWLDAYGWVWTPTYVSAGWRPYTVGRWVYTDLGWTFASSEPWGWATYHYGRWLFANGRWLWVPGNVWAPAWVTWRVTSTYIGWAPLPPQAWFSYGAGFGYWDPLPSPYWVFVHNNYFLAPGLYRYAVAPRDNPRILPRAREVRGTDVERDRVVNRGISVERIERATGRDVEPVRIAEARDRARARLDAGERELRVYRPDELRAQRGVRDTHIARERPPPEAQARLRREERAGEAPALQEDAFERRQRLEREERDFGIRPAPRAPEERGPVQRPAPRAPEPRGPVQRPTPRPPEPRGPVQRPTPRPPEPRGPVQRPTPRAPEPRGTAPGGSFDLAPTPRFERAPIERSPGFAPAPPLERSPGFTPTPGFGRGPGVTPRSPVETPQRLEQPSPAPSPAPAPSRPPPQAPAGKTQPRGR